MAGKLGWLENVVRLAGDVASNEGSDALRKLYTKDVYHGTKDPNVTAVLRPDRQITAGSSEMARALGMHVAPDPSISSARMFVGEGNDPGNILPLKMLSDDKFYEIDQPQYKWGEGQPRHPRNVASDDRAVTSMVLNEAYQYHPEILVRYLKSARNMNEPGQAEEFAAKLLNGETVYEHGQPFSGLSDYVRNYNPIPFNSDDAKQLLDTYRNVMRQRGYSGLKYFNTGVEETKDAKDYTSYIVFPPATKEEATTWGLRQDQPFALRSRHAEYNPESIHESDLMKAYGGEVDDDIDDALRIAKDVGGSTPAFMSDPTLERAGMMDVGEPENYEAEVKPFIDAATAPMNYAVEDPAGYSGLPVSTGTLQTNGLSLLDTMKAATQIAASGQPIDEYGEGNWGQARERAVRRFVGAPGGGEQSPYRGPFTYNPSDTADYINTLIGFSPYGWAELAHDIPYEAVRTGDYKNAAYEGGLNALFSAPGIAALGLAGRSAINAIRKNPRLASAIAAATAGVGASLLPSDAEADHSVNKALELTRDY